MKAKNGVGLHFLPKTYTRARPLTKKKPRFARSGITLARAIRNIGVFQRTPLTRTDRVNTYGYTRTL